VGLDKKIPLATQQIDQFYKERFPTHDSDVAEAWGNLAKENGVKFSRSSTNGKIRNRWGYGGSSSKHPCRETTSRWRSS